MTDQPTIFSVQSSVLHGFVGNETAAMIYPKLGLHLARLDSIKLPAHPGHQSEEIRLSAKSLLSADDLAHLIADLRKLPTITHLAAIHSGYFANAGQAAALATELRALKQDRPALLYLLDPVLGDHGRFYVDKAIADAMRDNLLPLADIITPNAFELATLTSTEISSLDAAETAARQLLNAGPSACLATGLLFDGQIYDLLVEKDKPALRLAAPAQPQGASGAGDCLAALFLGYHVTGLSPADAARKASQITQALIAVADDPRDLPLFSHQHLI